MQRHEWKKINIENDFLRRPGVRPAMTSKSIYAWLHVSVARVASECVRHVKSIKCCSDKGRFCHFPLFVFASLLFYFIIHIESYMCFVLVQIFVSFCFKLQSHSFFFAVFFVCVHMYVFIVLLRFVLVFRQTWVFLFWIRSGCMSLSVAPQWYSHAHAQTVRLCRTSDQSSSCLITINNKLHTRSAFTFRWMCVSLSWKLYGSRYGHLSVYAKK